MLERYRVVRGLRNVDHARAEPLLCVPDLAAGRELEIADDDRVAAAADVERARDRVDAGGGGGGQRNLGRVGMQQGRDLLADPLAALDPPGPVGTELQPVSRYCSNARLTSSASGA